MSLPSLLTATEGKNIEALTDKELDALILTGMKADLPLACKHLHALAHGKGELATTDPKSELGKQIIRICASDVMRPLAEEHLCHGKQITFYNCCTVQVSEKKPTRRAKTLIQIQAQTGPIARADC